MHPLMISSPSSHRGRLSPVSALVLRVELPSTITPSIGTFSPGCTTITEPGSTHPVHLAELPVCFYIRIIRPDVHQVADIPAALPHSVALEPLAHLVEQHYGDGLHVIARLMLNDLAVNGEDNGAKGGDGHQKALVKRLPVLDPLERLDQDVVTDHHIRDQIQDELGPGR